MTWSTFYLICFLVGFGMSALSLLSGSVHLHMPHLHFDHGVHLGHGHGGQSGASWFNLGTMAAFLAWFGGTGYLLEHYYAVWFVVALAVATLSGLGGASVVFWFLAKVLMRHEEALDPADYDMVGVLGKLSMPIRTGGTGELIYVQGGTRRVSGARGMNSRATWSNRPNRRDAGYGQPGVCHCGADGFGADVSDDDVRQAVPQGGAARGHHCLRVPRHARGQGPRHGDLSHGGKRPRAVVGTDELRRGAEAGPLHAAGRGGYRGSRGTDQGEERSGEHSYGRRAVPHQVA